MTHDCPAVGRRRFIAAVDGTLTASLAGCPTGSETTDAQTRSSPTDRECRQRGETSCSQLSTTTFPIHSMSNERPRRSWTQSVVDRDGRGEYPTQDGLVLVTMFANR
ncbi:hypothetical protein [Halorhabdus rudnickae]|uniref:hypothetical protein n=1 Tax=Halorhabdus rudnickae TaxID=1775544 RepID=UPI0010843071|nr:hypothetical protein [Halorhabdus rudnickae]